MKMFCLHIWLYDWCDHFISDVTDNPRDLDKWNKVEYNRRQRQMVDPNQGQKGWGTYLQVLQTEGSSNREYKSELADWSFLCQVTRVGVLCPRLNLHMATHYPADAHGHKAAQHFLPITLTDVVNTLSCRKLPATLGQPAVRELLQGGECGREKLHVCGL